MVLPPPAADPGAARAPAWLGKLIAQLELARRGIVLALVDAVPTQLGTVVRALSKVAPWEEAGEVGEVLEVCLRADELVALPRGSRVLLRVREEDLGWLNLHRPVFTELELRAVLWLDDAAHYGVSRRAVDLYDWISRLEPMPPKAVPEFAVERLRAALEGGERFVWRGPLPLSLRPAPHRNLAAGSRGTRCGSLASPRSQWTVNRLPHCRCIGKALGFVVPS